MFEKLKLYLKKNGLDYDFNLVQLSDDGDGVVYISHWGYTIPKPTIAELNQITEAEINQTFYAEKRQAAYPSIGDQLDALWKGGDAALEMKQKIDVVKQTYPKV